MRVAITTLGCKVNHYDSAALETRLRADGHEVVAATEAADVFVVNSCSVTDRADAESRQLARRARRNHPDARVVVTGCFAQTNPNGAALPEVDAVVGLNRMDDLIAAVKGELGGGKLHVDDLRTARKVTTIGAEVFPGQTRAFLKIQEGCDLFCTFCIVPFSRGKSRSVPPRVVREQLERLAELGFKEVVLTGVHLGGYGHDLESELSLVDLLESLVAHSPVPRLRLSSIDPPEVTSRLLELVRDADVLCEHLHIPVQAGADAVLQGMRRKYGTRELADLGERLQRYLPEAAIGTDVIAGFPGETDADFNESLELLQQLPLTYFHVFPYSKRTGTTAAKRQDHLPVEVIRARAQVLRELGDAKRAAFAQRHVGSRARVLVEEGTPKRPGWMGGYSRNYQRVEVLGGAELGNREVEVAVDAWDGERLLGRVVEVVR